MTKSTIIERLHNNDFCLIAEIGVNYYDIAKKLNMAPVEVYGVVSFYKNFSTVPTV